MYKINLFFSHLLHYVEDMKDGLARKHAEIKESVHSKHAQITESVLSKHKELTESVRRKHAEFKVGFRIRIRSAF